MSNYSNKLEDGNTKRFLIIVKSILLSVLLTLILLFVFSIILAYTNISENTIPYGIIFTSALSILISSVLCMLKIKNNGIIYGGIIGMTYMLLIYLLSSIVQTGFELNLFSIIMIIAGCLCGMLGGIIGVNIK